MSEVLPDSEDEKVTEEEYDVEDILDDHYSVDEVIAKEKLIQTHLTS
jgi:hypothetical protein